MADQPTAQPKWTNTGHAVACTQNACVDHCPRRRGDVRPAAPTPNPNGQHEEPK